MLAEFGKKFPLVQFDIQIGLASEIVEKLLRGQLDFGFVDTLAEDKRVFTRKVFNETIELCTSPTYLKSKRAPKKDRAFFESLDYIAYLEQEPITRMWFHHNVSKRPMALNIRARVIDCYSVARLIMDGLGAGVLPSHLVDRLIREGNKLHRFQSKQPPLRNAVSLAYLKERSLSTAAQSLMQDLEKRLHSLRK